MKKAAVQPTGRVFCKHRGSSEFVPVDMCDKARTSPAARGEDEEFFTGKPAKKPEPQRSPVFVNDAHPSSDCSPLRFRRRPHRFPSLCR